MLRKTTKNNKIGAYIRDGIAYKYKRGETDGKDKIAQDIGHRKPYSTERLNPHEINQSDGRDHELGDSNSD